MMFAMAALVISSVGALVTVVAVLWLIVIGARKDGEDEREARSKQGLRRRFP
jgi:hypothetical protein